MNERQMEFRVGVVVFATAIIGALLATLNSPVPKGWVPWGQGKFQIAIELMEAPGVGPDTPVRKSGLLIGRVASIEDRDDRIVVYANIDAGRRLFPQYKCQVRTTVLGDATIDFITTPVPPGTQPLANGAVVQGEVVGNPLDMLTSIQGDLKITIESLGRAGNEVANLAKRVDTAFGTESDPGRVPRLLDATENAINQFGQTMTSVNDILGGSGPDDRNMRNRLRQGLNELPDAVREGRLTLQDFRGVLQSAEKNFRNLEGFTEPLGQKGARIADSIVAAGDGLEKIVQEFAILGEAMNNREGTIGQLIHNPDLYQNANILMKNADIVLRNFNDLVCRVTEMSKRLQVVVEDARIFMDKVAREPGRIVGGAVNPSVVK